MRIIDYFARMPAELDENHSQERNICAFERQKGEYIESTVKRGRVEKTKRK